MAERRASFVGMSGGDNKSSPKRRWRRFASMSGCGKKHSLPKRIPVQERRFERTYFTCALIFRREPRMQSSRNRFSQVRFRCEISIENFRDELQAAVTIGLQAGRSERIRTSDPHVPNVVRYQTALHSVTSGASIDQPPAFDKRLIAFFVTSFSHPLKQPCQEPVAPAGRPQNVTKKQLWQEIFIEPHTSPARRLQIC